MVEIADRRYAYSPYSRTLEPPGDRRRFCFWARERGIDFRLAHIDTDADIVYLTTRSDLSAWTRYRGPAKVIYELIDSYLDLPTFDMKTALRGLAKYATHELSRPTLDYTRALEEMCRRADAVVCSTQEQKARISELNSNVHVILDAHDEMGNAKKTDFARGKELRLVWEGLPENIKHFEMLSPVLRKLATQIPLSVNLITAPSFKRYLGRIGTRDTGSLARKLIPGVRLHAWEPNTVARVAIESDLAVIPLDLSDPFAAGKPENKLLIFWRLAVPAITSATPAYLRAMEGAGLAMACGSPQEWAQTLRLYANDQRLREVAGQRGRSYVEENHTHEKLLARWDAVFRSVVA